MTDEEIAKRAIKTTSTAEEKQEILAARTRVQSRSIAGRFRHLKQRSKKREDHLNLTQEQYAEILEKTCFYCQDEFRQNEASGTGLDRIDNSKGYHFDNIVKCCAHCNYLRGSDYTQEVTKILVQSLIAFKDKDVKFLKEINDYYEDNKINFVMDRGDETDIILPPRGSKEKNRLYQRAFARKLSSRYASAKNNRERNGKHEFSISLERYSKIVVEPCYYCNDYFRLPGGKTGVGLDRADNSLGYTLENVVSSCSHCNYLKRDNYTPEQTQVMVKTLIFNRKNISLKDNFEEKLQKSKESYHTEETRNKLTKANLGSKRSLERVAKVAAAKSGKVSSARVLTYEIAQSIRKEWAEGIQNEQPLVKKQLAKRYKVDSNTIKNILNFKNYLSDKNLTKEEADKLRKYLIENCGYKI